MLDLDFSVNEGFFNQRMIARRVSLTWKMVQGVTSALRLPYAPVWSSETSQEFLTDTRQCPQLFLCPTISNWWAEYKPYQALLSPGLQRIIKSCAMHTLDGHKCVSNPRILSQPWAPMNSFIEGGRIYASVSCSIFECVIMPWVFKYRWSIAGALSPSCL